MRVIVAIAVILLFASCTKDPTPKPPATKPPSSGVSYGYTPAGYLVPSNSGQGRKGDSYIYAPKIRFPLEKAPAYVNSQVYGIGGYLGAKGSLCDKKNYQYPWHDNYCEKRGWGMPLCPTGKGHQGNDIRGATCVRGKYYAVAVERGIITYIGSYSVYLRGESGRTYRYLHLASSSLRVKTGQRVERSQRIGLMSDNMGSTSTSIHLHFDVKETLLVGGYAQKVYVPIYTSLIDSYNRLLKGRP